MNVNHIMVDTNVIIGAYYSENETDINCLQYLYSLQGKTLYLSSLSVAQFVALLQKRIDEPTLKAHVRKLLQKFVIVSFQENDIKSSLQFVDRDIEDCMQYAMGKRMDCHYFVTNNTKDYKFLNIFAIKSGDVRQIRRSKNEK